MKTMRRTSELRRLVEDDPILVLPGIFDSLSGRLAEEAGFKAIVAGGYAATASLIGAPDIGQLGMKEMAEFHARLCEAVELPVLADADTGYGEAAAMQRTMREFEKAGVAGIIIEDQVWPKRCGHMDGKRVVSITDMLAKIKAALDSRIDPDLLVVARTDARAIEGLEAAIERGQIYREAGADMIFVEAPLDVEEMARICSLIPAPCLANNVEGGKTPVLSADRLEDIGYAAAAFPVSALYVAAACLRRFFAALRASGDSAATSCDMLNFSSFNDLVGLTRLREQERAAESFARELLERLAAARGED
jgi:methylisocitrate lyase